MSNENEAMAEKWEEIKRRLYTAYERSFVGGPDTKHRLSFVDIVTRHRHSENADVIHSEKADILRSVLHRIATSPTLREQVDGIDEDARKALDLIKK